MMLATLALLAVLMEVLILDPSVDKQMKQLSDTADAARRQNEQYLEKSRQEETNQKLNDIEDAIILNGDKDGD